jgi:uncharacterized protein YndB with AHSA1/START domain
MFAKRKSKSKSLEWELLSAVFVNSVTSNRSSKYMAEIVHYFVIHATREKIFPVISSARGLNSWWTKTCEGSPSAGEIYKLGFGEPYQWEAVVSEVKPLEVFEMQMTKSDDDWTRSVLRFELHPSTEFTAVRFFHTGWRSSNEHFRVSNYCWAMYLRLLKLNVETGLVVPYDERLDV